MPLYKITTKGSDKVRLVDATSEAAALKHAAAGQFSAAIVRKPADVAALMSAGAKVEVAGEPIPADDPPAQDDKAGAEANKVTDPPAAEDGKGKK